MLSLYKDFYLYCGILRRHWNNVSRDRLSINFQGNIVAFSLSLHGDFIGCTAELSCGSETLPVTGKHRFDLQSIQCRLDTEDGLRDGNVVPCRGATKPGVLCLTMSRSILARDHLGVDIGFTFMQFTDDFTRRRVDPFVIIEGVIPAPDNGFGDHDPWIC